MQTYETAEMTKIEAQRFTQWHTNTIGTDYELNEVYHSDQHDQPRAYVVAWDMLPLEIGLCRAWEQSHIPAPTEQDLQAGRVDAQGWVI
jgi:hypothetical protein